LQGRASTCGVSSGTRRRSGSPEVFHIEVWSHGECLASGDGSAKKEAEQRRRGPPGAPEMPAHEINPG
jgi:hypothetical protein